MKRLLLLVATLAFTTVGCQQSSDDGATETPPTSAPADASSAIGAVIETVALNKRSVEAGCGMCIYEMDGVESCHTAIMVDGSPRLVAGVGEEAHDLGLCSGAKQVVVTGTAGDGGAILTAMSVE